MMRATILTSLALACSSLAVAQESVTVFRGAKIYPVAGDPIDDGVLIVAGGKVQLVAGADASLPVGATIVECQGTVITPGLVDAGTSIGLTSRDANEQGEEITPQVHVLDAIDPQDKRFDRARASGVTTLQVGAGNRNVIGGLGVVLKNRGETTRKMLLRDESGLRLALGAQPSRGNRAIRFGTPTSIYARRPTTRMGVVWEARKAFYDALEYREQKTVPAGEQPPPTDPGMEVLLRAIDRELVVHTTAQSEQDIRTALRLAEEFGYETLVEGGTEAWSVIEELSASGVNVLLSSPASVDPGSRADGAELRLGTVKALADAGIRFAIQTGQEGSPLSLIEEAMMAVRNGLDEDKALAAITQVPAEILGVDDRVGSLQAGRDADFVLWTGSPFDPTTRTKAVYIDGVEIR